MNCSRGLPSRAQGGHGGHHLKEGFNWQSRDTDVVFRRDIRRIKSRIVNAARRLRIRGRTHAWLEFKAELGEVPPSAWMLLGEARSKREHIAGRRCPPYTRFSALAVAALPVESVRITKELLERPQARALEERMAEEIRVFGERLQSPEAKAAMGAFSSGRRGNDPGVFLATPRRGSTG